MHTDSAPATRFKNAEHATRTFLAPDQFAVLRLDGKAFHSYCKGLAKPADENFMSHMDGVAKDLLRQIDGAQLCFVQSDEISVLCSSWKKADVEGEPDRWTQHMFGGSIQKLVSVSAALATASLNTQRLGTHSKRIGLFDSRAFSLPTRQDVVDYFAWRQHDATTNAMSMHASTHFSHASLHGVGFEGRRQMLADIGVDADSSPLGFRRGRVVTFVPRPATTTFENNKTGQPETVEFVRRYAESFVAPIFDEDDSLIPSGPPVVADGVCRTHNAA